MCVCVVSTCGVYVTCVRICVMCVCCVCVVWGVYDCTCIEVCIKEQRRETTLIWGPEISAFVIHSHYSRFTVQSWPKWAVGMEDTISKCIIEVTCVLLTETNGIPR